MMLRGEVLDVGADNVVFVRIPQRYGRDSVRAVTRIQVAKGDRVYVTNTSTSRVPQWVVFDRLNAVGTQGDPYPHEHPIGQVVGLKDWLDTYQQFMGDHEERMQYGERKLAEAEAALAQGRLDMEQAERDLAAARDRIAGAEGTLVEMDARVATAVAEHAAIVVRLDQAERDITAAGVRIGETTRELEKAQERIVSAETAVEVTAGNLATVDKRLTQTATDLSTAAARADSAFDEAGRVAANLSATDKRLTETATTLTSLSSTVGDVSAATQAADRRAQEAYNAASTASSAAQTAMSEYDRLRVKLDAALAARPGLITDSSFELVDQWAPAYGASIITTSVAKTGSRVLVLPWQNTSTGTGKPVHAYSRQEVQVIKDHRYRLTAFVYSTGDPGAATANFVIRRGAAGNNTYVANTTITGITDSGGAQGRWTIFQADWVAPASYDVQFGFQARNLTSDLYVDDLQGVDSTAEASLQIAVADARQRAEEAAADALAAMTRANLAQQSANGKSTITATATTPSGVGLSVGDTHFQLSGLGSGATITGQWRWNGNTWVKVLVDSQQIAALDVGKLTGVFANISQHLKAGSVGADRVSVGVGQNMMPWSMVLAGEVGPHGGGGVSTSTVQRLAGTSTYPAHLFFADTSTGTSWRMLGGLSSGGQHSNAGGQDFPVTPGRTLRFSTSVLAGGTYPEGLPNFRIGVYFRRADGPNVAGYFGPTLPVTWSTQAYVYEVQVPDTAASAYLRVWLDRPGGVRVIDPDFREMTDGSLVVRGSITGDHVAAESVAARIGQFVKVQATNVEVTESLASRVVNAMTANLRNLIVTGDATLAGTTWAKNIAAQEIAATTIKATNVEVTTELAARVVNAMNTNTKNLVVTESAILQHTTLLGTTVAERLNVTKMLRGRDAILDGTLDVAQLNVTNTLSAAIVNAMDLAAKKLVVTQEAILQHTTLLGTTVAEQLNVTKQLIGRDAILTGTVDVAQLNVTGVMSAEIARMMDATAKRLIVTDDAILNRATVVQDLVTSELIARRVDARYLRSDQISTGLLEVFGRFRTAPDGQPQIIIQPSQAAWNNRDLAVWFTPDGSLPGGGNAQNFAVTGGMWMNPTRDSGASWNPAQLNLRGQSRAGVQVMDGLTVRTTAGTVGPTINSFSGQSLNIIGSTGANMTTLNGDSRITPWGGIEMLARNGNVYIESTPTSSEVRLHSGSGGVRFTSSGGPNSYTYSHTTTTAANAVISTVDGKIYRNVSSRRYKKNIGDWEFDLSKLRDIKLRSWNDKVGDGSGNRYFGAIAEELVDLYPEHVPTVWDKTDDEGNPLPESKRIPESIEYLPLAFAAAVEGWRDADRRIQDLEARLDALGV